MCLYSMQDWAYINTKGSLYKKKLLPIYFSIRTAILNNPHNVSNMFNSYYFQLHLLAIMLYFLIDVFQENSTLWPLDGADDIKEIRHIMGVTCDGDTNAETIAQQLFYK